MKRSKGKAKQLENEKHKAKHLCVQGVCIQKYKNEEKKFNTTNSIKHKKQHIINPTTNSKETQD